MQSWREFLQEFEGDELAEVVYLFEERAALCEESGATREQAEQMAADEVMGS